MVKRRKSGYTKLAAQSANCPPAGGSLLKSSPPFFFALLIMAGYAVWEARTPVTMIAPFQLPKSDLPFTGHIVADAVQDGLKSIHNEIVEDRQNTSSSVVKTHYCSGLVTNASWGFRS